MNSKRLPRDENLAQSGSDGWPSIETPTCLALLQALADLTTEALQKGQEGLLLFYRERQTSQPTKSTRCGPGVATHLGDVGRVLALSLAMFALTWLVLELVVATCLDR